MRKIKPSRIRTPQRCETTPELDRTDIESQPDIYWGKVDFVFNVLAFQIGVGNFGKFPYLCYFHGGGAFLIPYIISLLCVGIPLTFFEFSVGQLSGGRINCWMFCPLFAGIGQISLCNTLFISTYYIIEVSWYLLYACLSFKSPIPWRNCHKEWSSFYCRDNLVDISIENCTDGIQPFMNGTCYDKESGEFQGIYNRTLAEAHGIKKVLPAEDYMKYVTLNYGRSPGLHDIGSIQWPIAVCLGVLWFLIILLQLQGVKWYKNIAYVTVTVPFCVLFFMAVRLMADDGSGAGIYNFIFPDASKLVTGDSWTAAIGQVFYSLGLASNVLIVFARRNRFESNILRAVLIVTLVDTIASIFGGIIIFGLLGSFAARVHLSVKEIAESHKILVTLFALLPQELAHETMVLTITIMYFFIFILITFSSQLAYFDSIVQYLRDYYQLSVRSQRYLSVSMGLTLFLIGLTMTTSGGVYIYTIFQDYSNAWSVVLASLLMMVALFVYGAKRFCNDIEVMIGSNPLYGIPWKYIRWYFIVTWTLTTPLFLLIYLIVSIIGYQPSSFGTYIFPAWANAIGWSMFAISIASFFAIFISNLCKQNGNLKMRLWALLRPDPRWGVPPGNPRTCPCEIQKEKDHPQRQQSTDTITEEEEKFHYLPTSDMAADSAIAVEAFNQYPEERTSIDARKPSTSSADEFRDTVQIHSALSQHPEHDSTKFMVATKQWGPTISKDKIRNVDPGTRKRRTSSLSSMQRSMRKKWKYKDESLVSTSSTAADEYKDTSLIPSSASSQEDMTELSSAGKLRRLDRKREKKKISGHRSSRLRSKMARPKTKHWKRID